MKEANELIIESKELIKTSKYTEALLVLDKAFQLDPNNIELLELRADMLQKANKMAAAMNDLNRILEIDPNNDRVIAKKELVQIIITNIQLDIYASPNTHLDPWI